MLLSKYVTIKINPSNLKRLKEYYVDIKNGELKEISVSHLSKSSHTIVSVQCDVCFKIKSLSYKNYIKSVSNGNYYACSQKCSKNKGINTNLDRYGEINPSLSKEIKDKIKKTNRLKYGVDNVFQSEIIKQQIKISNIEKYGVEFTAQTYDVKQKIKETNLNKYGFENVYQSKIIKDKIKETNLNKYGVEYPSQSEKIRQKMKQTNMNKYGVEYAILSDDVKQKIKETNLKRYGFINPFQSTIIKNKIKETNLDRYGVEHISQNDDMYELKIKSGYRIKIHEDGLKYQGTYEKEFIDYCIDNNIKIIKPPSFRYYFKNKERKYYPDFYYPELNLIIEVKSSYYYNIHKDRNELKKQSVISNNFNYIMILDKNYNDFLKMIKNI